MVTSDFRPEVEIRLFHACAMHPAIITGTVRSLLTWLWGRYHVPQNAFLVTVYFDVLNVVGILFLNTDVIYRRRIKFSVKCPKEKRGCRKKEKPRKGYRNRYRL